MNDFPRLSAKEYVILDLLRSGGEMFGLEMVKASQGNLRRGTVYVTLSRMCEKGYLTSKAEDRPNDPGMPRRLYRMTALGQRALRASDLGAAIFAGGLHAG